MAGRPTISALSARISGLRDATLQSLVTRFLSRPRTSHVSGLVLVAPPGVFHPGLFFSTRALVAWLTTHDLRGCAVLDLGSGSGALAIAAARAGGDVTAVELNPRAQVATLENAMRNGVHVRLCPGDGWGALPDDARFDLVLCNPPWFDGEAANDAALAFRAGDGLRFIHQLFAHLDGRLRPDGTLVTVFGDSADRERINAIALSHGWAPVALVCRRVGWEWQTIERWRRVSPLISRLVQQPHQS
jgi:release factor glutamine methyltransferase